MVFASATISERSEELREEAVDESAEEELPDEPEEELPEPEETEEEAFEEAERKKVDSGMGQMSKAAADASEALQGVALTEQEAASEEETVMSPLSPAPAGSSLEEGLTAEYYQKRLEDVDRIVKELRETDSTANTADSVKNIAEYGEK